MTRDPSLKKLFFVAGKAIIVQNEKVLLIRKERKGTYFWDTPGGCIHGLETPQQALTREMQEEVPSATNIHVGELANACVVERDISGDTSLALFFYHVTADFKNGILLGSEHDSSYWAELEELPQMASEGIEDAVRQILRNK
jgi:8-oxo-dGTP pyrophosphatase MutT (NUDIX family)